MRIKLVLLSMLLASCSDVSLPSLTPYKMDIRQGNYITPEMREKLKLGMPKTQVRYLLGTPMIADAFHGNRWDYVYRLEQQGKLVEKQRLTLVFEGDYLLSIDDGKTVQTAPVVVAAPAPVVKADPEADVLKSVQGWAAVWSARNVPYYLASYTPDFKPEGMSRAAWEKQRSERIGKPKSIEVVLDDINVSLEDDTHATVSFTQNYRADVYHDQVEKTLQLVKQSDRWLIASELAGKAVKAKPGQAKADAKMDAKADKAAGAAGADQQAVQDAVRHWADAWSARDVEKYLASYGASFKPSGMSKAAWEKQRKERIVKAGSIAVEVSDLNIKLRDERHASATFKQGYRSDTHQDNTRKTLQMEKVGDAWLIVSEQAAK
jgi:outer membrane protein assembly factor BamE